MNEKFTRKEYISKIKLEQIRTKFGIRTKLTKVKMNMKNGEQNWIYDSCETAFDTQIFLRILT